MNEGIKIYCILFDTTQLNPEIEKIAYEKNAHLLYQVSQCYTQASVFSMFTGKQLSDLEPHGTGYYTGRKYQKIIGSTQDGDDKIRIEWPWKEQIWIRKFLNAGWKIKIHNGEQEGFWNHWIDYHPDYEHTTCCDCKNFNELDVMERLLNYDERYINSEKEHIKKIQSEKHQENIIHVIFYHENHTSSKMKSRYDAAYDIIHDRLEYWDMEEENCIFWFWSDHGDYSVTPIDDKLMPNSWLQWVLFRDNTSNPIKPGRRLISIRDFYPTVLEKFGLSYEKTDAYSIDKPCDPDRIYFVEDSRFLDNIDYVENVVSIVFLNWANDLPAYILQCTFNEKKDRFRHFISDFNNGYPNAIQRVKITGDNVKQEKWIHLECDFDELFTLLKNALRERFDWIGCWNKSTSCKFWEDKGQFARPACCTIKLEKLFSYLHDLFKKHQIEYWIMDGALLGLARSGQLIPWDLDIDLGMDLENYEKVSGLIDEISQEGYHLEYSRAYTWEGGSRPAGQSLAILCHERSDHNSDPVHIDIFPYVNVDNQIVILDYWWRSFFPYYSFPESLFMDFDEFQIFGRPVRVPSKYPDILCRIYGMDWKIPKRPRICKIPKRNSKLERMLNPIRYIKALKKRFFPGAEKNPIDTQNSEDHIKRHWEEINC